MTNDDLLSTGAAGDLIRDLTAGTVAPRPLTVESRGVADVYILPSDWRVHQIDTERYQATPTRKTGTALFTDPGSFLQYIDDQDEVPTLYADPEHLTVTAVFDDHVGDTPGWRQFRAVLTYRTTPEWNAWTHLDRQFDSGEYLAEFIEQWRHTIAEPSHADLLTLVRSFRATRTVTFRDERVDASGDRSLEYVVETGAGGKGELQVPDSLGLVMAPFEGTGPVTIPARFRYRLGQGTATFGVVLEQPDKVMRDLFVDELAVIESTHGSPVLIGSPAA